MKNDHDFSADGDHALCRYAGSWGQPQLQDANDVERTLYAPDGRD